MKRLITGLALAGLGLMLDRRAGSSPGHVVTSAQDTPTTGFLAGDGAAVGTTSYPGLYGSEDQDARRAGIAPGHVIMSARATPAPGFLSCDGEQHAKAAFPALYDAIGDAYNDGDEDPGYFRVPNYADRFPSGHERGSTGGVAEGETQDVVIPWSAVPEHVHDITAHTHPVSAVAAGGAHSHNVAPGNASGLYFDPTLEGWSNLQVGISSTPPSEGRAAVKCFSWYYDWETDEVSAGGGAEEGETGDNDDTIQTGLPEAETTGDDTVIPLEHQPPAYTGNNFEIKT